MPRHRKRSKKRHVKLVVKRKRLRQKPRSWVHVGGGCMFGGGKYPCDDTYENPITRKTVTFSTTQERHFDMPRKGFPANIAKLRGVKKV